MSRWHDAMFASSAEAMFRFDAAGRIVAVNAAFRKLTGYSSRELAGKRLQDITPPEHARLCEDALRKLIATGETCTFDKQYLRGDGTRVAVRVTGFVVKSPSGRRLDYGGVARDAAAFAGAASQLRERQADTETALREALSLSAAALESTADGLLIVDRRNKIRSFNRRFTAMWRIPRRMAATRDDARLVAYVTSQLENPESFVRRIRELYARPGDESFDTIEFKDGRIFERYSRPQYLGRRIVGRVWSFRDVTEQRKLEREIAGISSREQERIGRELHDSVGQTLTAISLIARSAFGKAGREARQIHALSKVAIRQVRSLSRGLLPPELGAGDFAGALRSLATGTRALYGVECLVTARGDTRLSDHGAAVEIYRIAQEAVYNAAKHARARTVRLAFSAENGHVKLSVTDDGVGIRTRRRRGQGLGLPIMQHRARLLGGTLSVARAGRRGTLVTFVCPRPQAAR